MRKFLSFQLVILCFALKVSSFTVVSDSNNKQYSQYESIIIDNIEISGNKKTKAAIILRELTFEKEVAYEPVVLEKLIERAEEQIFNLGIFNSAKIELGQIQDNHFTAFIKVVERWYHVPIPILMLASRNFNTWWVDENRDFNRVIYGLKYRHQNFRGRNESLDIALSLGYNQSFRIDYGIPYINKKKTIGLRARVRYLHSRKLNFATEKNKLLNYEDEEFVFKSYQGGIILRLRKKFNTSQEFGLHYLHSSVLDTITEMNRNFFQDGSTLQQYFHLFYIFEYDNRDVQYYPLSGHYFGFYMEKLGIGIFEDVDYTNIKAFYSYHHPLGKKFYAATKLGLKTSFPYFQPYINQQGLGFGDEVLHGYEYYVIDGQHYFTIQAALKKKLFEFELFKRGRIIKDERFRNLPVRSFLKVYGNIGYVRDRFHYRGNPLNNELLLSWGLGMDFPLFYDQVLRLEYSWNRFGGNDRVYYENAFYVHFSVDLNNVFQSPSLPGK